MKSKTPEAWFENCIVDGLSAMFSLSLQGTPAMEVLPITAKTWAQVLWQQPIGWERDADVWRLQDAFMRLMGRVDRFPAPKTLMDVLPERKVLVKIGAPKMSDEERHANLLKMNELLRGMLRA